MQPEQLKSLVETGDYRPEPALIAEAMLRRRGVRELLTGEAGAQRSWSKPVRLQQSAPGQPDLDPLAGDDLADRGSARSRASPRLRRIESLRRDRRQQLVVLAAGDGQLQRIAARSRRRPRRPVRDRQRRGVDPQARPRCPARWPASPPSPSLRSIIAVAPAAARARPASQPRHGSSWRRAQRARRTRRRAPRAGPGRSSSRPAAAPPSSPVRTSASPGLGPGAADELLRAATHGRRRSPPR